jgi:hypothetical protein
MTSDNQESRSGTCDSSDVRIVIRTTPMGYVRAGESLMQSIQAKQSNQKTGDDRSTKH